MKNFFAVSAVFCMITGTSSTVFAQPAPSFIEGIELVPQPVSFTPTSTKFINTTASIVTAVPAAVLISTEACKSYQFKYAQILNRNVESITNSKLFEFIEEWWDTRYRYGGTSKSGIDCSAFTSMLMTEVFQKSIPRTAKEQYNLVTKIDHADLTEGDLLFFNTRGGISHVGVYLSDGYFVHASTSSGVTISNLSENYYSGRYLGAGRL